MPLGSLQHAWSRCDSQVSVPCGTASHVEFELRTRETPRHRTHDRNHRIQQRDLAIDPNGRERDGDPRNPRSQEARTAGSRSSWHSSCTPICIPVCTSKYPSRTCRHEKRRRLLALLATIPRVPISPAMPALPNACRGGEDENGTIFADHWLVGTELGRNTKMRSQFAPSTWLACVSHQAQMQPRTVDAQ